MTSIQSTGPLHGKRIIELAGIGPAPYCGQLLADLGAEVILIDRPEAIRLPIENRGKKSIVVDLHSSAAAEIVLRLCEGADALIEGLRPGVTERLGIGPEECQARNPKLVYGRMTGWGQTGPWADMAGHDINYLSITGALYAIGQPDLPPPPPLNTIGDYGGGSLFLALGVVSGILQAQTTGKGDIVDTAIIDGVASMLHIVHSLDSLNRWSPKRGSNLLDGATPYYRCYRTQDDQYMAVGCLEPQFYAIMLEKLGLEKDDAFQDQNNFAAWPEQTKKLTEIFASATRDHWAAHFDGCDACVTPVLNYREAADHPHNAARQSSLNDSNDQVRHPNRAPRQTSTDHHTPSLAVPTAGVDSVEILEQAGFDSTEIETLLDNGTIAETPC